MTPAARLSAAITVLDRILGGASAEVALTNWGRASRFAGSGDRNAVRDLVFDALRCRRSFGALGGGDTGRGQILGSLRAKGIDAQTLFTGHGHDPAALSAADTGRAPVGPEALDCPDWLYPLLENSLTEACVPVLEALRQRAPDFVRVNIRRQTRAAAMESLAREGIATRMNDIAKTALEVTDSARKIKTSQVYLDGLIELQDASSQAVVENLPLQGGMRVLDLCAGGGGKALAMAAQARIELTAHDIDPKRMRDLPERALRAKAKVSIATSLENMRPYDLVLADVPCSGSGSWRRDPQGKWSLTQARLEALMDVQAGLLEQAAGLTGPNGHLAYVTCSLLRGENEDRIAAFLGGHKDWNCISQQRFSPTQGGDGFFLALLTRAV
jgi:16S rRNA (cytosine967-C5)-methyltransferase